ncbi:hypothetical protein GJ744_008140 [Endocarpon pusillum]|uniref:Uncharacterized protein n=1 Tax=Endocarpon pusillum TaxID=364733 RepID=A0A8H7E718_9EURO|nr:hypothetical protein GJ744_008140 [Endocarpon pusillum]
MIRWDSIKRGILIECTNVLVIFSNPEHFGRLDVASPEAGVREILDRVQRSVLIFSKRKRSLLLLRSHHE